MVSEELRVHPVGDEEDIAVPEAFVAVEAVNLLFAVQNIKVYEYTREYT